MLGWPPGTYRVATSDCEEEHRAAAVVRVSVDSVRGWLLSLVLVPAIAGTAHADLLTETPEIPKKPSLTTKLEDKLQGMANELESSLEAVSFDVIGMRFDVKNRAAKVHVGGVGHSFGLRLDGDVTLRNGGAHIDTRINLKLRGTSLDFDLPGFDMVPRSYQGRLYMELRLAFFETTF